MPKIILDASHGGNDAGLIYHKRLEKDDTLRLALAVGEILQHKYGYDVVYTRTTDTYLSQLDRVKIANGSGGDLLVSLHRTVGNYPYINQKGLDFSVYDYGGAAEQAANTIAEAMKEFGFENYSISIRTDLPVIRDTMMPAVMMGVGYMYSYYDNQMYDTQLHDLAEVIAQGIVNYFNEASETLAYSVVNVNNETWKANSYNMNREEGVVVGMVEDQNRYKIQVGLFRNYEYAWELMVRLFRSGYPADIQRRDGLYSVTVGEFAEMDDAVALERRLRREGYNTLLVTF